MKEYRLLRQIFLGVAASSLAGCSTFSFAPPLVQTEFRLPPSKSLCGVRAAESEEIRKDFRGARSLIDNFTVAYRCSVQEAADGRQIFEVPSFLALVAAAIGPSFGLSMDGRLAAVAGAAVYGRANSYYAPREKLPALDAALDAVICVKSESIGVAFFDTRQGDVAAMRAAIASTQGEITNLDTALLALETRRAATSAALAKLAAVADASSIDRAALASELTVTEAAIKATQGELATLKASLVRIVDAGAQRLTAAALPGIAAVDDPEVLASANEQYFEMVSSALLSIERVLGQRLKSAGKYDPAGLQAEIGKAITDTAAADDKVKNTPLPTVRGADRSEPVRLRVLAIQPRLQSCVIRAKLG